MQGDPRYPLKYQLLPKSPTRHPQYSFTLSPSCIMKFPSKFVTSYNEKHGLTHFLTIPLVKPTSRPQFRDSFKCLWDDLAALDVPKKAIRSLNLLHLDLATPLSLKTRKDIAKATEILQKLFAKQTLPTIHGSSASGNHFKHSSRALTTSNNDTNNSMAPPSVSISGLFCKPGREAQALSLGAKVYDATHRVRDWKVRVAHAYQAAGLSPGLRLHHDFQTRAAMLDSSDATVSLMGIPNSGEVTRCKWMPSKLIHSLLPSVDARGLLERYKDHVWIENAPLERVSICEMGFHKAGPKELREVVSVPL